MVSLLQRLGGAEKIRLQVERLMKRDSCTRELAEAKIGSQMPQETKRRRSQYVVDNSGSHSSTRGQARCGKRHATLVQHHTAFISRGPSIHPCVMQTWPSHCSEVSPVSFSLCDRAFLGCFCVCHPSSALQHFGLFLAVLCILLMDDVCCRLTPS